MKRYSQCKLTKELNVLFFTFGVTILILYSAIPDYFRTLDVQAQLQQQLQPPPVIGVKITSPTTGQQVPIGELTISGTSTDNATTDCTVYADWNNTKPFQTATATGPGGVNDYSRWTFTYTDDYHLITNGTNNLTSKLSCFGDESNIGGSTANLTKSYSVNVIGVATTGAVSATKEQNYDSNVSPSSTYPPVMTENENNNTDATTTITTPPEEPTIYWDLDDIEEEDIDRDNKQVFELEDNIFGSPGLSEAFQCGYNLGLNNSSLTREQISEYCNNLILETENVDDMTIFGFGPIFIIVGLIIIGIGSAIWLIVRRRKGRKARTESLSGVSMEMMTRNREEEEEHHRFTTKKVLTCSIILGLISALLSIFIDWLHVLSMAAFVFASITVWYMFGEKLHRWKETREKKREINIGYKSKYN
jgi:phosphatidylglycerophosphate synthase